MNANYEDSWERFKAITRAVSKVGIVLKQEDMSIITNKDKVRELTFFYEQMCGGKGRYFCEKHTEREEFLA